ASCVAICFLSALLIQTIVGKASFTTTIEPGRLDHVGRYAFVYSFTPRSPIIPGMILRGDTNWDPSASTAIVLENGKPLGPSHNATSTIDTLGHGRFSHWVADKVFISSSDGTDPRTNGRTYELRYRYEIPFWLWTATILLIAAT